MAVTKVTNNELEDVKVTGWGFITGAGAAVQQSDSVSFGVTFDSKPIVLVSYIGAKASDPSDVGDFTIAQSMNSYPITITTTGFTVEMSTVYSGDGNLINNRRYGYTWIAIGTIT